MIATTLAELAALTGGEVHHDDGTTVVRGAAGLDSRTPEPGGLFVALAGERADGHDFAAAAHDAGAAATLCSRPVPGPCVVVPDVQAALGAVGRSVVERLEGCTVIALTGSQGKTSTKDLLAQVLEAAGPTVATRGNHNNELGVPLTLTRAGATTRFLVVEMGARHVGNIAYLCSLARPDVAMVLNVGTAHVGEFGSRDAIARAKGEIVEALGAGGTAVLNADDPLVAPMAGRTAAPVLRFGRGPGADVRAEDVATGGDGCPRFVLAHGDERHAVHLPLLGEHQADNAAAATAAALAAGVPLAATADVLGRARPRSAWRMERTERADGAVVVNDAYNANPDSMRAALRTVQVLAEGRGGRARAVLGEMLELGADAAAEHRRVGREAASLGIAVVAVGDTARPYVEGAREAGGDAVAVADVDAAAAEVEASLDGRDVVLLKASRAAGLERAAALLTSADRHTSPGGAPAAPAGPPHRDQGDAG